MPISIGWGIVLSSKEPENHLVYGMTDTTDLSGEPIRHDKLLTLPVDYSIQER